MSHSDVGIVGYGVYIPIQRIRTELIVKAREANRKDLPDFLKKVRDGLLLRYKAIAGMDEDTITIASEAGLNAITMAGVDPEKIGTVAVGSESKPYAVGTIARHVASFTGIGSRVYVADLEGACNAGMQALSFVQGQVADGKIDYGLAIGADVAQAPQGDPLEYACGAGAGAFVVGRDDPVASIEDTAAYSSLTMDFWRRDGMPYPSHFGRTTVEAYVKHVIGAIEHLLSRHPDLKLMDFDYLTFHQPSGYMPLKACKTLCQAKIESLEDQSVESRIHLTPEYVEEKVKPWLRVLDTGNTYAASTPIALCDILDHATPGENILAVSYGSGAYTIATWLKVQEGILRKRGRDSNRRAVSDTKTRDQAGDLSRSFEAETAHRETQDLASSHHRRNRSTRWRPHNRDAMPWMRARILPRSGQMSRMGLQGTCGAKTVSRFREACVIQEASDPEAAHVKL